MISVESRKCITVLLSFCWLEGREGQEKGLERGAGEGREKEKSYLDEGTDDTKGGEAQVLKRARFGRRI
jgi:hypothetical protein